MSSKALQDMTMVEFLHSVVTTRVGSTNLQWVVVPSEEAKQDYIAWRIEEGYECGCGDGPQKCLESTTIVVPGTEEGMATILDDDGSEKRSGTEVPVFIHVSVGNLAFAISEGMKMPLMVAAAMYGLNPEKMDQAGLEEALAEAKEVIDNVEDFLASFDTDGQ